MKYAYEGADDDDGWTGNVKNVGITGNIYLLYAYKGIESVSVNYAVSKKKSAGKAAS